VAEVLPPDSPLTALVRRLDDLLSEAKRLRSQIETAMNINKDSPFWPDRRQQPKPVPRDRRR
jgi:hypothetical protein